MTQLSDLNTAEKSQFEDRPTRVRFEVLVWLTLAALLAYLTRNAVGVAESTIREELDLSLAQSGWFMGAFFWTYAIFQVPAGWMAHRGGTHLVLASFAVLWSLASLAIGLSTSIILLIIAQLVMGLAQAGIFPASCNSISHWMPIARRSLSCAILCTGMQVGAILASFLTGELIGPIGWRFVFMLYAIPGFIWTAFFLFRFQNDPRHHRGVNAKELSIIQPESHATEPEEEQHTPTPWLEIVATPAIWFLCGQQICRAAGYMFYASWFPTFLQETRGISVSGSGYLQALVFGGTLTGSLVGGLVTDAIWSKTNNLRLSRSGVGATALFLCSCLILAATSVNDLYLAMSLLTAGALFAALAGPCAFAAAIDLGGKHVPQVFGLMNMSGNLAAAACPVLVGALFDIIPNWNVVLFLFAGIYMAGAISWALVDPKKKLEQPSSAEV